MIGIIAAMQEELQEVLARMQDIKEEQRYGVSFYLGTLEGNRVVAMLSGVAKINATFSTAMLIEHYKVVAVINVGSAGGLRMDQKVLDVVVSTCVAQHDLFAGNEKGVLSGQPRFIDADPGMVAKAMGIASKEITLHNGLIVSGDQFIEAASAQPILVDFPDAHCVDMEAAAIAFVCHKMKIPFVIVRSLSDLPYEVDNALTFQEYLPLAAHHSALIASELVRLIGLDQD